MSKKKRHLNEAWFEEGYLCIQKDPNIKWNNYTVQECLHNIENNEKESVICGLWCPKCRYLSHNEISICGEIYFTEEYFGKE